MNEQTDQELLRNYIERKSDSAFAALVERYVDLVHSAALRMSGDADSAKDITQCVFVALSHNARQLTDRPTLAGWLHNTARNLAAKEIRSQIRRRDREQEAVAMIELLTTDSAANWDEIAPHLDAALGELSEPERDALLLRYFKNKDLRTVGATFGISDDAAQKRVSRAVERLREFFAKRGVTVGASGLAVVISANAVQAAPVGLTLTISTAAALTVTTLATTATATATKAIAMTALQKTVVTTTIAVLAGAVIFESRQASQLRDQVQTLKQLQASLAEENQSSQSSFADATNRLAELSLKYSQQNSNPKEAELLKLRGEVGLLRQAANEAEGKLAAALSYEDKFKKDENNSTDTMKYLSLAMHQWALDHNNSFATNLLQLTNELANSFTRLGNSFARNGVSLSSFDFLNDGSITRDHAKVVILRERFARQSPDGTWRRIYGFADGRVITAITVDGNFDAWEKVNTESLPSNQH